MNTAKITQNIVEQRKSPSYEIKLILGMSALHEHKDTVTESCRCLWWKNRLEELNYYL